jgi:heavy metal translocating P-type ATPase
MATHASCSYCGLPVTPTATEEPQFCCFGCRFAASIAGQQSGAGDPSAAQFRLGLAVFFAMNVMVFTMFLWSQPEQVTDQAARVFYDVARYLCLLFSIPVVLLLGPALVEETIAGARTGRMAAGVLLLVGIAAALLYSAWSVVRGQGHVYFEVGVMVLVLVTLGRWLEGEGKLRTTRSLRELQNLLPQTVRRVTLQGMEVIDLQQVAVGNQIRILPGERIAVDGIIVRGRAAVDEQTITGEAVPIEKDPGDKVFSGTFNLDGELIVKATTAGCAGTLQRLLDTVMEAARQRNPFQRLADRIAAWLLPLVAAVAVVTFLAHLALPSADIWPAALEQPLLSALAVLVIACPCALGLATPMALWAAVGRAANEQVLFRRGDALSQLAAAKTICFDKTGTLTTGQLTVVGRWFAPEFSQQTAEHVSAALCQCSNHPVATALAQSLRADPELIDLESVKEHPGRGLRAWIPSLESQVVLGGLQWIADNGCATSDWVHSSASTEWKQHALACLAIGGRLVAVFALDESLRPEAKVAIESLRRLGLSIRLLSGDRRLRVAYIADQLGIEYDAELLPHAKRRCIRQLAAAHGPVIMVGDGLNDAPALAAADIGIALGCGADLSRDAASVCILSNRLDRIPWTIELARDTTRALRWNLLWAFGYNLAAVPLAAMGLVNPIIAAVAMAVSSLLVVANSLKLAASTPAATMPSPEETTALVDSTTPIQTAAQP